MNTFNVQRGFSLIELLVTLVITAVALLGMIALQARATQAQFESYQRAQALLLVEDMVNRLAANRDARRCYETNAANGMGSGFVGVGVDAPATGNCTSGTNVENQLTADRDLIAWDDTLDGEGEELGSGSGTFVGGLLNARGCILFTDLGGGDQRYTVAVSWQGQYDTVAPAVACGTAASYGGALKQRTVSVAIEFSDLST